MNFEGKSEKEYQVDRMSIFNAYYFPNNDSKLLYDNVTPVNSFRIVFDSYFQTNYGLLEDKIFFSTPEKPFTLIEITDLILN